MDSLTLHDLSSRLRKGLVSAETLVRLYLQRIGQYDKVLQAYVYVDHENALSQARAIDVLRAAGTDLGPLMGLPVAIKDLIHVDGMPTRAGSQMDISSTFRPEEGELIRKLKNAGCIILGKTRTAEFALSSSGINYRDGTPRNPWDANTARAPGGSSSGSAVAEAAGLCAFAIGTDTGGSVRTPAAYCGVVGIKFSPDALDKDGVFVLSDTLDSYGIFTRQVACARLVCETLGIAETSHHSGKTLRLGVLNNFQTLALDPEVARCWNEAIDKLKASGHTITELSAGEWHKQLNEIYSAITRPEIFATLAPYLNAEGESLVNPEILRKVRSGASIDATTYITALRKREGLVNMAHAWLNGCDALITPTKPTLPPTYPASYAGDAEDDQVLAKTGVLTREANLLNLTGASLPIHQLGSPLPVGLQVLCRGDDLNGLLRHAARIEESVGPGPLARLDGFL